MIEKCKCGAIATTRTVYVTHNRMHGFAVICSGEAGRKHWGAACRTEKGAVLQWNRWQRSCLSVDDIDRFISIRASLERAIQWAKEEVPGVSR